MAMQMYRYFSAFFQPANQLKRIIRLKQTSHIFNTNRMGAHIFNLFAQSHPGVQIVNRTGGIRNSSLSMSICIEYGFHSVLNISHVIHGIEYTENINAVDSATLDKLINYIVSIMSIA